MVLYFSNAGGSVVKADKHLFLELTDSLWLYSVAEGWGSTKPKELFPRLHSREHICYPAGLPFEHWNSVCAKWLFKLSLGQ